MKELRTSEEDYLQKLRDSHPMAELRAENGRLRAALLDLYNGTAEYVYLNNLGDPHNTTPMQNAADVLGVTYPRSLGAKNMLHGNPCLKPNCGCPGA